MLERLTLCDPQAFSMNLYSQPFFETPRVSDLTRAAEVPQLSAVRSRSTCHVMVITRDAYKQVEAAFPLSARAVLQNLLSACEQVIPPLHLALPLHPPPQNPERGQEQGLQHTVRE